MCNTGDSVGPMTSQDRKQVFCAVQNVNPAGQYIANGAKLFELLVLAEPCLMLSLLVLEILHI